MTPHSGSIESRKTKISAMLGVTEFNKLGLTGLASDSRKVKPGYLFAALTGTKTDGARFVRDAVARGAVAVLGTPALAEEVAALGVRFIPDDNPRAGLAYVASLFFSGQPEVVAAVTGTKGKSSIVAFLREIWTALGRPAASIGTVGVIGPNGQMPLSHTTPDPVEAHALLARLKQEGVDYVAIEASSHGLDQHRLDGVKISGAGFSNITRDHMDYHPTFDDYLAAKLRLFTELVKDGGVAVINADAEHAERFITAATARDLRVITVGNTGQHIKLADRREVGDSQDLRLAYDGKFYDVHLPLAGAFQASNALVAAGLAIGLGEDERNVFGALEGLKGAPGRMEKVAFSASGAPIYVDYAHTPDSLEKVLNALRPYTKNNLIVVFGCGGNRDKGKRALMGAIAAKLADVVIITDDNPRNEDPETIRREILMAAPGAREIGDRTQAIQVAIGELERGDVLVLAGKGHETGQYIKGHVVPFSDREVAVKAAVALGGHAA